MRSLDSYNIVLHRQSDGRWAAYVAAIESRHALMPTRDEALDELQLVFEMSADKFRARVGG